MKNNAHYNGFISTQETKEVGEFVVTITNNIPYDFDYNGNIIEDKVNEKKLATSEQLPNRISSPDDVIVSVPSEEIDPESFFSFGIESILK